MPTQFRIGTGTAVPGPASVDLGDLLIPRDAFSSGGLWCWGFNTYGQLGDNSTITKSSPVQTIAVGNNWKQVGCGAEHVAAIKTDGTLLCWGRNNNGQLGDNSTITKSSPVQTVTGGTNWKQVGCGSYHTSAIKTDGTLWCWGQNTYGQLGDNSTITKSSPVQTIAVGNNWKQVGSGYYHTSAIKTDGTLWCWGSNTSGQLGDNSTITKSSPVQTVTGGTNWKQVGCGSYHTSAIKTDGTLWCWGQNTYGQLGNNSTVNNSSPVQTIAVGNNWKQVGSGYYHTSAIKTDGTLWCWGYNEYGQLGDNSFINRSTPVQTIAGGNNWKQGNAGYYNTSAIKTDGTLWCWGYNYYGQLGDNSIITRSSPVQTITGGTNWKQTSNGSSNACVITE